MVPFATGLSARPSRTVAGAESVGVADEPLVGAEEGVDGAGAHADAVITTAAMMAMERTTTSSYEEGMRNLLVR